MGNSVLIFTDNYPFISAENLAIRASHKALDLNKSPDMDTLFWPLLSHQKMTASTTIPELTTVIVYGSS